MLLVLVVGIIIVKINEPPKVFSTESISELESTQEESGVESMQEVSYIETSSVESTVQEKSSQEFIEEIVSSTPEVSVISPVISTPEVEELYIVDDDYSVPEKASSFKSYMDYRCITDKRSKAYQVANSATKLDNGLLVVDNEYYCVAMGTYYGQVGDKFYIETNEGNSWKIILCDIKANSHTDSTNRYTIANGCMMEFVVDTRLIPSSVKSSGTVNGLGFSGKITLVRKIG